MKILFVKPPQNSTIIKTTVYEPLEFEYLAASVPDYDTEIIDMRIEKNLMRKLEAYNPDVVGITAYTCDIKTVKEICREIKKYKSNIKIVIGGVHVTFLPQDFNHGPVDTIFLGYADHTFPRYMNTLIEGGDIRAIENLGFPVDGQIYCSEKKMISVDLDSLPFPDRQLTAKYRSGYHDVMKKKLSLIMTSRGCPFRCVYCACWKMMEGRYANRSVDSIIKELESLPEDVESVFVTDDNTLNDTQRAWLLAEKIKEHKINKKFKMYARADTVCKNPELLSSLKEAGLDFLVVGFESITDNGLKKLNKMTRKEINDEAIKILKNLDIDIDSYFIVDPEFTEKDFESLFNYVDEKHLFRPVFSVLTPLPGTQLFEETVNEHVIKDYDLFDFGHSILSTRLERKEFYRQFALLYRKSYSIRRYLKHMFTKGNTNCCMNTDGMSLLKVLLAHIFYYFPYLKLKNAHKSEILSEEQL